MPNIDQVTVSLSRLALAKAIKTPDAGDQDAEPWTKSIIFHQPHIDAQMRNSILNPKAMQSNRRKHERYGNQIQQHLLKQHRQSTQPLQQHQHHHSGRQVVATTRTKRPDEMRLSTPSPPTLQKNRASYFPSQRPSSPSTISGGRSSRSSGKKIVISNSNRKIVPSDDEEDDDDEEEDDDDDQDDDDNDDNKDKEHLQTENHKTHVSKSPIMTLSPLPSAIVKTYKKGKSASRIPQPSDDEESDQQNDITDDSEDEDEKQEKEDEQMYARRMSTLRRLETGPSVHRRTRSTGDMIMLPPVEAFIEPATSTAEGNKIGSIEQWRVTVMEADGISTPTSSASVQSHTTENPSEREEEEADMLEETVVLSNIPSAAAAAANIVPRQQTPMSARRSRRSTLGEMDMFYYQQQQQQQLYNMQLQQAMQMQQAQQMAQFQQYQAMQMQQQQQAQLYNLKSVSAMDLMIQMEQKKTANRKSNRKLLPDSSKAPLADGLISRVPKPGQHNMNFQHQLMEQQKHRAGKGDHRPRHNGKGSPSRPYSSMMMINDSNIQSQMIRSESSPIPGSMPALMNQPYLIPPNQQQQMPMLPQTQMMPMNRLSQYWSNQGKRQSTYSGYDNNQF